ncbi:uncharacterized protein LOC118738690 [Rhagoletis pomonella]|uniref:uncharacterized protein LOC118738690 n=1 Tax=Rhagoletis pomonella TaxID=28610 RepID=UPI00177F68AB|nr:uncharacterized protein LOC118738690 [Rhagoletis pomonella]
MDCFMCGINLDSVRSMSYHFRLVHNLGQRDIYKCTFGGYCNTFFSFLNCFVRHVRQEHMLQENVEQKVNASETKTETTFFDSAAPSTSRCSATYLDTRIIQTPDIPRENDSVIEIDNMLECLNEEKSQSQERLIEERFIGFALILHSKNNFTRKDVVEIQDSVMKDIVNPIKNSVKQFIQNSYISKSPDSFEQQLLLSKFIESMSYPFRGFENEYQLFKWLNKNDYARNFEEFVISREIAEKYSRGVLLYDEVVITGVLLPLSFQFRKALEKSDLLLQILKDVENIPKTLEEGSNFICGSLWKQKSLPLLENGKTVLPFFYI